MFTKKIPLSAKTVLFGCAVLMASVAPVAHADELSDWMFGELDADSDGKLTKKEFRGAVFDSEGQNWTKGLGATCLDAARSAMDPNMTEAFDAIDTSKDGAINKEEFATTGVSIYNQYWEKTFESADKNGDKNLVEEEFVSQVNDYFENLKKDYTEKNIPAECVADLKNLKPSGDELATAKEIFAMMDANGDKKLSYNEFMGTE